MAKRYYWLKLKEGFFDDKRIKKLRSIAGGDTFTIIYLKMMLRSLQTEGILVYEGLEDTFAKEVAMDINEDPENVQVTVSFLLSVGLLEDKGTEFSMPDVLASIGSEWDSAERMRKLRKRQPDAQIEAKASLSDTDVRKCDTEIEIDIEKEKDIDIEKDKKVAKQPKHKHGTFNHVLLTEKELESLQKEYGETETAEAIKFLDEYIEESGKKYKNHNLTLRRWVFDAVKERKAKKPKRGEQKLDFKTFAAMKMKHEKV